MLSDDDMSDTISQISTLTESSLPIRSTSLFDDYNNLRNLSQSPTLDLAIEELANDEGNHKVVEANSKNVSLPRSYIKSEAEEQHKPDDTAWNKSLKKPRPELKLITNGHVLSKSNEGIKLLSELDKSENRNHYRGVRQSWHSYNSTYESETARPRYTFKNQYASGALFKVDWCYQPSNGDELCLSEGEVISSILTPHGDWWTGMKKDGTTGWFPASHVHRIEREENSTLERIRRKTTMLSNAFKAHNIPKFTRPSVLPSTWCEFVPEDIRMFCSDEQLRRQEAIYELYYTEHEYVKSLEIIVSRFLKPMREDEVVDKKGIHLLFSNVETLYNLNTELLDLIEQRYRLDYVVEEIGGVFNVISDYLKVYAVYCSNHGKTLDYLKKHKNGRLKRYIKKGESNLQKNYEFRDLLIQPVQRICKYPLLIKSVLKYTSQDSPDYKILTESSAKIQGAIAMVNSYVKQRTMDERLEDLRRRIPPICHYFQASRKMQIEGSLFVQSYFYNPNGDTKNLCKNRKPSSKQNVFLEFVLFTDLMIVVNSQKKQILDVIPMQSLFVILLNNSIMDAPTKSCYKIIHHKIAEYIVEIDHQKSYNFEEWKAIFAKLMEHSDHQLKSPRVSYSLEANDSNNKEKSYIKDALTRVSSLISSHSIQKKIWRHSISSCLSSLKFEAATEEVSDLAISWVSVVTNFRLHADYVFVIEVHREGSHDAHGISKTFDDFCDFHIKLLQLVEDTSSIPELPLAKISISPHLLERMKSLSSYLSQLFKDNDDIRYHKFVKEFFSSDTERVDPITLKEKLKNVILQNSK